MWNHYHYTKMFVETNDENVARYLVKVYWQLSKRQGVTNLPFPCRDSPCQTDLMSYKGTLWEPNNLHSAIIGTEILILSRKTDGRLADGRQISVGFQWEEVGWAMYCTRLRGSMVDKTCTARVTWEHNQARRQNPDQEKSVFVTL